MQHNMKTSQLIISGLCKLLLGMALIGLLLFLPAGTWHYWQAWLLLVLLFVPMTCMGIWLLISMPELLAKRLNNKEKEQTQKFAPMGECHRLDNLPNRVCAIRRSVA